MIPHQLKMFYARVLNSRMVKKMRNSINKGVGGGWYTLFV